MPKINKIIKKIVTKRGRQRDFRKNDRYFTD